MSTPVGAVQANNPQRGVKRATPGNPTHVPGQAPGFRGRSVDAGAAVKAPKLRNGNLNNETSNVMRRARFRRLPHHPRRAR